MIHLRPSRVRPALSALSPTITRRADVATLDALGSDAGAIPG